MSVEVVGPSVALVGRVDLISTVVSWGKQRIQVGGGGACNLAGEVGIVETEGNWVGGRVEGRVGGTRCSRPLARLLVCDLAREEAVVASYLLWGGATFDP